MVDLKQCRAKFYSSFNSIYCKISKSNEFVIVNLVKSFCVPIAMYSLEALDLNASLLSSLDNLLFQAFCKIFKSYDHNTINWCMCYMNTWPLKFEYFNRKFRFLTKLLKFENILLLTSYNLFGNKELLNLCNKFNAEKVNSVAFKNLVWNNFESTLSK